MSNRRCSPHRRATVALLTIATLAVALVSVARPQPAAAVALPRTPASGTITLTGAGFGHGRGMGQWGAYGYALKGWDWLSIVRHFYPTTLDGTVDDQQEMSVRLATMHGWTTAVVAVKADGTPNVVSDVDPVPGRQWAAMAAVDVGAGVFDIYASTVGTCPTLSGDFATANPTWEKVATDGQQPAIFRPVDLAGSNTTTALTDLLGVCEPDGEVRALRGQVESWDDGRQRTVNRLTLQSYLRGVVPRESPPSWGDGAGAAALGTQAVAARSYALSENRFRLPNNGPLYAKTCDDQDCQVYGGAGVKAVGKTTFTRLEDSRTDNAVMVMTPGAVRLRPDGQVAVTEFSASTGGLTTGGSLGGGFTYDAVIDDGDDTPANPNHRWTTTLTTAKIEAAYPTIGSLLDITVTKRDGAGEWGGRVLQLTLTGTAGTTTTSGETFRGKTGIKSSWFTIVDSCDGREAPPVATLPAAGPAAFEPMTPDRFLDTRDGTGTNQAAPLRGGCTIALQVAGRNGVPADATAASLNVTVTNSSGEGYVTAWPCGTPRPDASTVNLSPGRAVANLSVVRIGASGLVCIFSQTTTDLVVDVSGWYGPSATEGFQPLAPERIVDTRTGLGGRSVPLQPGEVHPVTVTGLAGVPATGVTAASLQVTVTRAATAGWVRLFPCGGAVPPSSTVNFLAGDDVPNHTFVGLSASGQVCVQSNTRTDVVLDVQGWFGAAAPGRFVPVVPTRRFDTRSGQGVPDAPVGQGATLPVPTLGQSGVPASGVLAVLMNLTSDAAAGDGFITAFPCGTARRETSVLNPRKGRIVAGASPVLPGADGSVCLFSMRQTELLGDVTAYVVP
jgi:SpoIID/LytB domain protein